MGFVVGGVAMGVVVGGVAMLFGVLLGSTDDVSAVEKSIA